MTATSLFTYAIALFVAAAIPGPGMTALVARALGSGFSQSLAMAFGLILGDMVFLTAVVLGLAVLAQAFGAAFMIIKFLGVLYLLWTAYKIWTAGLLRETAVESPRRGLANAFLSGLFITLGNPKAMLFYVALAPTLLDLSSVTRAGYLLLLGVTFVVLLIVAIPYISLAARAREFFRHPVALRRLNRSAASCLALTAVYIAFRAH